MLIATGGCLLLLFAVVIGWVLLRTPDPHFVCHKGFFHAFCDWQSETTNGDWYPNIEGSQQKSLAVLAPYEPNVMGNASDYRYVPGLERNDPEDLILFYLCRPSRRTWHGDGNFLRLRKRWVVLGPKLMSNGKSFTAEWSECGEALSTKAFKKRLAHTLEYLRENNRTNWTGVVQDHTAFLRTVLD